MGSEIINVKINKHTLLRGPMMSQCVVGVMRQVINCNVEALKELNLRAQGEISIRDALRELELWGGGTCFNLLEHQDTHRVNIMLIKDYKVRGISNKRVFFVYRRLTWLHVWKTW